MKKYICIFLAVFLLIFNTGCASKNQNVSAHDELKAVNAVKITNESYQNTLDYSGYVTADEVKRFSFELSGKISDVLVEEGQEVKAGQVIAKLDTANVKMAVDNANENIKLANNQISQIDSGIEKINIGIEAEKVTLKKAETALDAERINLQKIQESYNSAINKIMLQYDNYKQKYDDVSILYNQGVAARTDYDNAKLALDTVNEELNNTYDSRDRDIELQTKKIETLEDDCELQKSSIKNMENELESAKIKRDAAVITRDQAGISLEQNTKYLNDSVLKSTIDGYVMTIVLHAGEITSAGTPVIIVKSGEQVINVGIPAEQHDKILQGTQVSVIFDNKSCSGVIKSVSLYPDEATRTYNVEVTPENQDIAMGSLVTVKIPVGNKSGCFIPISAVESIDGVDYVYTLVNTDENNEENKNLYKVVRTEIFKGDVEGENILVQNIPPDTIVVKDGIKDIRENQIVAGILQ